MKKKTHTHLQINTSQRFHCGSKAIWVCLYCTSCDYDYEFEFSRECDVSTCVWVCIVVVEFYFVFFYMHRSFVDVKLPFLLLLLFIFCFVLFYFVQLRIQLLCFFLVAKVYSVCFFPSISYSSISSFVVCFSSFLFLVIQTNDNCLCLVLPCMHSKAAIAVVYENSRMELKILQWELKTRNKTKKSQ